MPGPMFIERDLNELIEEWTERDGKVMCTYFESKLIIDWLICQETKFSVDYTDDDLDKIIIERM